MRYETGVKNMNELETKKRTIKHLLSKNQMSDAFVNSAVLALSGGYQDAYTYFARDGVFSNAQTGNVVLMSQHLMKDRKSVV